MCRFSCVHKFSAPLGKYQGVQLLDRMIRICCCCYVFLKTKKLMVAKPSTKGAIPFCTSTSNEWEFLLLRVLPAFSVVSVLNFGCSDRFVVVSYYFNLHFLDDMRCEGFFHIFICHCISSLMRHLLRSLAQFLVGFFAYFWVFRVLCAFWKPFYFLSDVFYNCFLPVYDLYFHSLDIIF